MDIEYVGIELKPLSKTKTQMKIVMMSDLNLKVVPQSLINWVVRKVKILLQKKKLIVTRVLPQWLKRLSRKLLI